MEFQTEWADWVALAAVLVQVVLALIGGTTSTHVTNYLKKRFNWSGDGAYAASWAVALGIGVLLAVASGALNPQIFTNPALIATVIITTVLANEKGYQAFKSKTAKELAAEVD